MKNKINKNRVIRGIFVSILLTLLIGILLLNILLPSFALGTNANEDSGVYFNASEVLNNPIRKNTSQGYYFAPQSYVYFGSVYNAETDSFEPILCRVLDADKDNNGESGAMFVLTENAISLNEGFYTQSEPIANNFNIENIYTKSDMSIYAEQEYIFTSAERELIRKITKADVASEMEGLYGYLSEYGYVWETDSADNLNEIKSDSAVLLDSASIFPLSVRELYDYVASYSGAPGMSTVHITTKASVEWWLRTGLNDEYGNLVGVVNKNGNVTSKSATSANVAGRFAFNIETDNISFVQAMGENVYRLAYKSNVQTDFSANIYNVKDNIIEINYVNSPTDIITNNRKDILISIMVVDADGNIKHYDTNTEPVRIQSGMRSFVLPNNYSDNDTVYVFWEEKGDNAHDISFTGEFVELECIHRPAVIADCNNRSVCAKCGEEYGFINSDIHTNISSELCFDGEMDMHWNACLDCGEKLNQTACTFGLTCINKCSCGNEDISQIKHSFNEDGICVYDNHHYEQPVRIGKGALSNFEIHNEGQFLFLAEYINNNKSVNIYGEFWGSPYIITLMADLNFSGIDFIPMGTEQAPFDVLYFEGKGHTISGINYSTDSSYAGIFGVAANVIVDDLTIKNCHFTAKDGVGILAGKATDVNFKAITVLNSTVNATSDNGYEGSIVGVAEGASSIERGSLSYNVQNSENINLNFSGNGAISVLNSFCLSENSNIQKGEMTLSQFESGEVGYAYTEYWGNSGKDAGQQLGVDKYPYIGGPDVFKALTCDGQTVYFNDASKRAQIEAHTFTAFAKDPVEFIWQQSEGYMYSCHVHAICGACGYEGLAEAEVWARTYNSSSTQSIPRIDYNATITLGDITVTDEYIIISNNIQDYIGMTNVVKDFDAQYVSPTDMLQNTRLGEDEFTAFFVNPVTGKKYADVSYDWYGQPYEYPLAVMAARTYDLHVIGEGAFEGQEYYYKEVLVIKTITITIAPKDVYKFYDGYSSFNSEFTSNASELLGEDWIVVKYGNSSSANVGTYALSVSVDFGEYARDYKDSVSFVLARNTVNAFILPANKVVIENKNYPTEFTYGDEIPIPTAENFNMNFDVPLDFEWYTAEYDYYEDKAINLNKISGQPKNAGTYLLRVRANSTDTTLATTYDLIVTIAQKSIGIILSAPENAETRTEDDVIYYLIDSIDQIKYYVVGLVNGDTVEASNIKFDYSLSGQYAFKDCPDRLNYLVTYYANCYDDFGLSGNYENAVKSIYVSLNPSSVPVPQSGKYIYNNQNVNYELLLSWNAPGVASDYGAYYEYTIFIYDSNDNLVLRANKGMLNYCVDNTYMVSLSKSGEYTVVINYILINHFQGTRTDVQELTRYKFSVDIADESGNKVEELDKLGKYSVTVTVGEKALSAQVLLQRTISMFVKETSIDLDNPDVKFNKENIVMKAGEVLLLGHTLSEVEFNIDAERGEIKICRIVVVDENGNDVSYLYSLNTYDSSGMYNILHVYDSSCDGECNAWYCDKTRDVAHSGGKATCTELATCDICGKLYGEYDTKSHVSEFTTFVVNPEDGNTHLELANCCGGVVNVLNHVPKQNATCTELAICSLCDWRYGELDLTNHSSNEISYSQISGNENQHTKTHLCCGSAEIEAHVGGKATCSTLAACDNCNAHYGEFNKENHENAPTCVLNSENVEEHKISYSCCGASWIEAHSGGKATCTSVAVCTLCNSNYGEKDAQNHASDKLTYMVREDNISMHDMYHSCCNLYVGKAYHSGGTATCMVSAICEHCGTTYGNTDAAVHSSNEYVYISNGEKHIKAYSCCMTEISEEEHKFSSATCMHGEKCEYCGYEQGETVEHIYDNACDYICNVCNEVSRAADFHVDENNDFLCDECNAELEREKLSGGAISGIAVGSVTIAGVGGFSLFWFVIKKKSLAALLKLLLG